jgi:hypothetical protein
MCLLREPALRQRMRRKIGPGHTGRIALRQRVDGLEPVPPRGIVGQSAAMHRGVERIEPFSCLIAAGGKVWRSAIEKTFVQAHFLLVATLL